MIDVKDYVTLASGDYITLLKASLDGVTYYFLNEVVQEELTDEYLMVYYDAEKQLRAIHDPLLAEKVFALFQTQLKEFFEVGDFHA